MCGLIGSHLFLSYTYMGVMYGKDRGEEWTSKDMPCVVIGFVLKI